MSKPMSRLIRILLLPIEAVMVVFIVLDEIARPLYRPLLRWVASLRLMHRMENWVAARHRLTILVLLAIPFIIVEPLKIVGLFWIGRGALIPGGVILALAHLAGFVIVERIYSAGKPKLLTIGWFAWAIGLLVTVRTALIERARQTAIWRTVTRAKAAVKAWFAR
ncbi:MAG TPA: hypothetical protein VIQ29_15855 [Ancylobacter sp.]